MTTTLIALLFIMIVGLAIALMVSILLLIRCRTEDIAQASKLSSGPEPDLVMEVASVDRRSIAEAAVYFALENQETAGVPTGELKQSPVSPWQAALRASTLHRRAVRR